MLETTETPRAVWRGNPVQSDHQPDPEQIVAMMTEILTLAASAADLSLVTAALSWQGVWDANTNSPTMPAAAAGNNGYLFWVGTSGATNLDGISDWAVGDYVVSDGDAWHRIRIDVGVLSIGGRSGVVTLGAADIDDSTVAGRALLTAADAAAQRLAIGAPSATTVAERDADGPLWSVGDGAVTQIRMGIDGKLAGIWPDQIDNTLVRRAESEGPLWSAGGAKGEWGNYVAPLWMVDDAEFTLRNPYLDRVAAQSARTTPRPRLYIAGDSRGDQSTNDGRTTAYGWLAHLQVLTGARFDMDPADNIAVAGSDTEEMLAAVGPLLTADPGIVVAISSTNDRTADWTEERSIAAMSLWQSLVLARGHQIIWIAEMPRGEPGNLTYELTGSKLLRHMRVRQWILDQSSVPGVHVADPWPAMCDHSSANGHVISGLMYDGLHTGIPGARVVAETIEPIITALLPPRPRLIMSAADLYSVSNNQSGSLLPNSMMGGTAGTVGAGGSGDLADGWAATIGAGMSATMSKTTLDDLPAQRVVVSGTPTGASAGASPVDPTPHAVVVTADIDDVADLSVGDVIEAAGLVKLASGSSGCRAASIYLTVTTASGTTTHCAMEPNLGRTAPNLDQPAGELSGPLVVPAFTVSEVVTAASVSVMIVGTPSNASYPDVPISATVDFTSISLRKVL